MNRNNYGGHVGMGGTGLMIRGNGGGDFTRLLSSAVAQIQRETRVGDTALRMAKDVTPLNRRGGHEVFTFDLGDARFTSPGYIEYVGSGQRLIYSIQGSGQGGVLDFDFDGGGQELFCIPGAKLWGPFDRVLIKRNVNSITSGAVYLRILNQVDSDYSELARGFPAGVLGNATGGGSGPSGALVQGYNLASGGANKPVLATDGLSLVGVGGVRANVVTPIAGTFINTASIQWWQWDSVALRWGVSDMVNTFNATAGVYNCWFPLDLQDWVPEGRIYPELVGYTDTNGAGTPTVRLRTWGN